MPEQSAGETISSWGEGVAKTLFTGLTVALFAGGITWLTTIHNQLSEHTARIAVLEAQTVEQRRQLDKIDRKIDDVNLKLDKLVDRK